jgi:hypothetical protein
MMSLEKHTTKQSQQPDGKVEFEKTQDTLVLKPDSDFFNYFSKEN